MVLPDLCESCLFGNAPRDVQLRGLWVEVGLGDTDREGCVDAGGGGGACSSFVGNATKRGSAKEIVWSD